MALPPRLTSVAALVALTFCLAHATKIKRHELSAHTRTESCTIQSSNAALMEPCCVGHGSSNCGGEKVKCYPCQVKLDAVCGVECGSNSTCVDIKKSCKDIADSCSKAWGDASEAWQGVCLGLDEEKGQISTQGWVGIGLGAAAIIGTIAYVLAKEPTKSTANKVKLVLSEPPDEMALRLELRQEQRNNWAQEQLDNGEKLSPELQEYWTFFKTDARQNVLSKALENDPKLSNLIKQFDPSQVGNDGQGAEVDGGDAEKDGEVSDDQFDEDDFDPNEVIESGGIGL